MDDERHPPRLSILKQKTSSEEELNVSIKPTCSRRVSFAASNYVKPFVADDEQNTIWDNTYEEIVNHTDSTSSSNNIKSCDEFNTTTIIENQKPKELRIWSDSDNESLKSENEIQFTKKTINIYEDTTLKCKKENLNPIKMNQTQMDTCDMELTMMEESKKFITEQNDEELEVLTMDFTKVLDRTIITKENVNETRWENVSMDETGKEIKVVEKEQIINTSNGNEFEADEPRILNSIVLQDVSVMDISLDLTCQLEENNVNCDNKTINDEISVEETKIIENQPLSMPETDLKPVENNIEPKIPDEVVIFHDTASKTVDMDISGISNLGESYNTMHLKESSLENNFKNIIRNNPNIEIDVSSIFVNSMENESVDDTVFIDNFQTNSISKQMTNLCETEKNSSFAINLTDENISINNLLQTVDSFKMIPDSSFVDDKQLDYSAHLNESIDLLEIPSLDEFDNEDYDYKPPSIPEELVALTNNSMVFRDNSEKIKELNQLKEDCLKLKRMISEKQKKKLIEQIAFLDEQNTQLEDFLDDLNSCLENLETNLESSSSLSSDIEVVDVVSVPQKVETASQRDETCYKYEKHENNTFYFSSLNDSFSFEVQLMPHSEIVQNIRVNISDRDYSERSINYFILKVLEEKLNPNNLKQLFGEKYDILTLLDYWNMAVEECMDFFDEFQDLQLFNNQSINIVIDRNYKVNFKLLSANPYLNWTITVKLCPRNYAIENDGNIEIYDEINKISLKDKFVNNYLKEISKDKHFFKGFFINIQKYFENTKKLHPPKDVVKDLQMGCAKYFESE